MPAFKTSFGQISLGQNTIDTFVREARRFPGHTVREYEDLVKVGRAVLKNVLRYSPEGQQLARDGIIAVSKSGRQQGRLPAAWTQISGAKIATYSKTPLRVSTMLAVKQPANLDPSLARDITSQEDEIRSILNATARTPKSKEASFTSIIGRTLHLATLAAEGAEVPQLKAEIKALKALNTKLSTELAALDKTHTTLIANFKATMTDEQLASFATALVA